MKKAGKIAIITIVSVLILLGITIGVFSHILFGTYETNNPRNYLKIVGNYSNEEPQEFVSSFFPAVIEESFSDVVYHYKAIRGDTYAYEAYLEFVIEDKVVYEDFVESIVDRSVCSQFEYDYSFNSYTVSNHYELNKWDDGLTIDFAEMGIVLFSDTDRRMIFVALGGYDGGLTNADELNFFFDRFTIEPVNFATKIWE